MAAPGDAPRTAGGQAGVGLADKIKGAAQATHGVGEGIRGNVNAFFDTAGESLTSNSGASGTHSGVGTGTNTGSTTHHSMTNPTGAVSDTSATTTAPGVAGRTSGVGAHPKDEANRLGNENVAARGADELREGVARLSR